MKIMIICVCLFCCACTNDIIATPSYSPDAGNEVVPADIPHPQMEFACACGSVDLYLKFSLDSSGNIEGFLEEVRPEDVGSVVFFLDEYAFEDCPAAPYAEEVALNLPGCSASGNLFLHLNDGTQIWANLGDNGSWEIAGAQRDGSYLVAECGRDCYCE